MTSNAQALYDQRVRIKIKNDAIRVYPGSFATLFFVSLIVLQSVVITYLTIKFQQASIDGYVRQDVLAGQTTPEQADRSVIDDIKYQCGTYCTNFPDKCGKPTTTKNKKVLSIQIAPVVASNSLQSCINTYDHVCQEYCQKHSKDCSLALPDLDAIEAQRKKEEKNFKYKTIFNRPKRKIVILTPTPSPTPGVTIKRSSTPKSIINTFPIQ